MPRNASDSSVLIPTSSDSCVRFDPSTGALDKPSRYLELHQSFLRRQKPAGRQFSAQRHRFEIPVRIEGITLSPIETSWERFDIWARDWDGWTQIASDQQLPEPPEGYRLELEEPLGSVSEVVLDVLSRRGSERVSAIPGELRVLGELDRSGLRPRITEIIDSIRSFTPSGRAFESNERATIRNDDTETVDLAGWTLNCGHVTQNFTFPEGTVLASGEEVYVWTAPVPNPRPGKDFTLGRTSSRVWNNSGDVGQLLDPEGLVIDEVRYGNRS